MVRFRLVDNRTKISKKIRDLSERIDSFQSEFLKELVSQIVVLSPVDTGTYMDAHNVGQPGPRVSSRNKPGKQPWQPHADAALERMFGQIDSLPKNTVAVVYNNAEHAPFVEYEHGDAPYTTARSKSELLVKKVADRILRGRSDV